MSEIGYGILMNKILQIVDDSLEKVSNYIRLENELKNITLEIHKKLENIEDSIVSTKRDENKTILKIPLFLLTEFSYEIPDKKHIKRNIKKHLHLDIEKMDIKCDWGSKKIIIKERDSNGKR